jgi:hypothetical protein
VVFAAWAHLPLYSFYLKTLEEMRTGFVVVNMADEPVMERLLAPRLR